TGRRSRAPRPRSRSRRRRTGCRPVGACRPSWALVGYAPRRGRSEMVYRSPIPDVEIPDVALTPFVLQHAGRLADKPALIDGPSGRTLTYGQLAGGIQRVAAGLAARGFGKGDVMAIYSPNLPEYALAFHAVATGGGVNTTA